MEMRVQSRERLVSKLRRAYPDMFIKTTEEFNGSEGGIWLAADDRITDRKGDLLFDYWADSPNYSFGVVKHLKNFLQRNGWFAEWHDEGTVMLWKI